MKTARDDEHESDGAHTDYVEDEDKCNSIDLYTATGETLEGKLGDPEDAENGQLILHTPEPIADVPLPSDLLEIVNAQKNDDLW